MSDEVQHPSCMGQLYDADAPECKRCDLSCSCRDVCNEKNAPVEVEVVTGEVVTASVPAEIVQPVEPAVDRELPKAVISFRKGTASATAYSTFREEWHSVESCVKIVTELHNGKGRTSVSDVIAILRKKGLLETRKVQGGVKEYRAKG